MLNIQGSVAYETHILPSIHRPRPVSCGYSRQKVIELSKPKESKQVWLTSFGPKLYWGDQDMMWPVTQAALKARPTQRLMQLATAKRNFQQGTNKVNRPEFLYSCGRTSGIWDVSKVAMKAEPSEHVVRLATPKHPPPQHTEHRAYHQYSCGRVSPIWDVTQQAKECGDRPRTAKLAQPKDSHRDYLPNREVITEINPPALHTFPSERIEELAHPKTRSDGLFFDSRAPEDSIWKVSQPARAASASPRIVELAKHKGHAEGFVPNRSVIWPVSRSARRAAITQRSEELAKPIIRSSMDHVQFNPDAFLVSPKARNAICSPRLEELAQPIQR